MRVAAGINMYSVATRWFLTGWIGILLLGVYMALKRQKLIFDLRLRRGIHMTWSPWRSSRVEREFAFDEIDCLTLRRISEAVSSSVYEKLELRLRVRPRTVIRVLRSKKERQVRELAETLSRILGVSVVE